MRILYNLLTYLLFLPYVAYWLIRGITNRAYLQRIGERLGIGYPRLEGCIWIHAVSVGEVVAAVPLIRALGKRYPDRQLLVTTVTPSGAARVAALFGDEEVVLVVRDHQANEADAYAMRDGTQLGTIALPFQPDKWRAFGRLLLGWNIEQNRIELSAYDTETAEEVWSILCC